MQHRKKHFLIVDPPGGKGDRLIYMGMEKKLRELGIKYTVLHYGNPTFFRKCFSLVARILSFLKLESVAMNFNRIGSLIDNLMGKKEMREASEGVVLIRGGGYLNDVWREYYILENVLQSNPYRTIIVGPHSFYFNSNISSQVFSELLNQFRQEIYLFCREEYSYHILSSMIFRRSIQIDLSKDTSFYLSKDDFHCWNGGYDLLSPREGKESIVDWNIKKLKQRENGLADHSSESNYKLLIGDMERVKDFATFTNLVARARRVYTDRLHVAILAGILGKTVFLYPNSYHKNKGVYEFSLRDFTNVKFVDSYRFKGFASKGISTDRSGDVGERYG